MWSEKRLLRNKLLFAALCAVLALALAQAPLSSIRVPLMHYLPTHTALEVVSVIISFLVFAMAWNTPFRHASGALLLVGTGLAAAGTLDFFHMLSFVGMPDLVTPASAQKSIAFHLAARAVFVLTLLGVSVYPQVRSLSNQARRFVALIYLCIVVAVVAVVLFHEESVPAFIQPGTGVTAIKSGIEWLLIGLMVIAALRFFRLSLVFEDPSYPRICSALLIGALGELFLVHYVSVNDARNLVAHIFKCIAYWLIFRGIFVVAFRKPYEALEGQAQQLRALNDSMRIHALALDSTATPVLVGDVSGKVIWRNKAALALDTETVGDLSLYAPPVTNSPEVAAQIRDALASGGVWRGPVESRSRSGKTIHHDRTVTPLRNEEGQIDGFVSVADNITDKVVAQLRHKQVLASALDGFCIVDTGLRFIEVNAAFSRIYGYSQQELLEMGPLDIEADERTEAEYQRFERIKVRGFGQWEARHRHKSGRTFPVEVSLVHDAQAKLSYAFVKDRTELAQASSAQRDLERQLQQAQKMEALGQLTGGIAHDFNNNLAAILGYSNLALDRFVPDKESKLAKYLKEVVTASERAKELVSKMLVFARTKPSDIKNAVSPAAVIREVEAMLRPSIQSSIALKCRIDDDLPIRIDASELNQMLVNLVINARDALDGAGQIDIRLHRLMLEGELCTITHERLSGAFLALDVSDNGSGISHEVLPRLFEPFFTTKDVGKGTGLGLPMVRGTLIRAGAHIVVCSEPGRGSCFRLLFHIDGAKNVAAAAEPMAPLACSTGGQCIWVVDDETSVAGFYGELLEGSGYRVRLFNEPATVVALMEAGEFDADALVTDQTMPGMSGVDLATKVLALWPRLPVLLCTGYLEGIDAQKLQDRGIRGVFVKPVASETLLCALADALAAPPVANSHLEASAGQPWNNPAFQPN